MYGYIYITTNLINNKKYIGKHIATEFDSKYYGSGVNLVKALKKYDKSNFKVEILEECVDKEDLNLKEIKWIAHFSATESNNFYNIATGGEGGGNKGRTFDDKWLKNMSLSRKGKKRSADFGEKLRKALKGRPSINKGKVVSEYTKQLMSKAHKGKLNSVEHSRHISEGKKGKTIGPRSEETKNKISQSKTGKSTSLLGTHQTPEHINKRIQNCCKAVQDLTTGQIFSSITEASNHYGVSRSTIRNKIKEGLFAYRRN